MIATLRPEILRKFFTELGQTLPSAWIFGQNLKSNLQILWSDNPTHTENGPSTMYDYPSLIRVLGTKAEIFDPKLEKALYFASEQQEVALIIEWTDYIQKVVIFNINTLNPGEQIHFLERIKLKHQQFHTIFNTLYQQKEEKL